MLQGFTEQINSQPTNVYAKTRWKILRINNISTARYAAVT